MQFHVSQFAANWLLLIISRLTRRFYALKEWLVRTFFFETSLDIVRKISAPRDEGVFPRPSYFASQYGHESGTSIDLGFEHMAHLFGAHRATRGLIGLDIDEASLLWRSLRELQSQRVCELGRHIGASTVLIAAALRPHGGHLLSLDNESKEFFSYHVEDHLRWLNLRNVTILVADTQTFQTEWAPDFIFVDAGHEENDVIRDFENWISQCAPKAFFAFHDAAPGREHTTTHTSVIRGLKRIRDNHDLRPVAHAGSLEIYQSR